MSNYGWVGKHTDELLQAVGMIDHAAALLSSDDRIAQRDAVKLLHMAVDESIVKAAALEWQPMKTAPKDGEAIILLTAEKLPIIAFWAEWETGGDAENGDPPEWDKGWCLNGCQTVVLIGKMIAWARLSLPDKFNGSEAEVDVKTTAGYTDLPAKEVLRMIAAEEQDETVQSLKDRLYVYENTPFANWVKRAEKAEIQLEKIKEYVKGMGMTAKRTDRHGNKPNLFCANCGGLLAYSASYDAYCCEFCNQWAEAKCKDPDCEFCSKRPEKPL